MTHGRTVADRLLTAALAVVLAVVGAVAVAVPAPAVAGTTAVVSTVPPSVSGDAVVGRRLVADPGEWSPSEVTHDYRWLRDGEPVRGAREQDYTPGSADLGHRLSVRVRATDAEGRTGYATSAPTARVVRADLVDRT